MCNENRPTTYEDYIRSRGEADMAQADAEYRTVSTEGCTAPHLPCLLAVWPVLSCSADSPPSQFKGIDQEFDGGDSGGGAVGDGNMDLEDQHNSPTLGALRGGIADLTPDPNTRQIGRGQVKSYADLPDESMKVDGATSARTASAGANYFGRSTGLADKLISEISEDDRKMGRMDGPRRCVR